FFFNTPSPTVIYTLSLHDALPILDVDVAMVDHVRDPDLGRDRVAALVDVLLDRGVRVTVDDPRHEVAAGRVDHGGAGRDQEVAADGGDLAVPDEHRTLLDRALGTGGQDRSAHDRDENRPGRNARTGVNPSL